MILYELSKIDDYKDLQTFHNLMIELFDRKNINNILNYRAT